MGRVKGKVAFITGAARGMGRTHAVRLASEGADVIALDVAKQLDVPYEMPGGDDLDETIRLVEEAVGRGLAVRADIRDRMALDEAVAAGLEHFGRIDVAVANAGIWSLSGETWTIPEDRFLEMIEINLTSQWRTASAVIPAMLEAGSGSLIFIASTNGLRAVRGNGHYTAAKHGVIGLMRTLALEVGDRGVRVNAVCPTGVNTPMLINDEMFKLFRPDLEAPTYADVEEGLMSLNVLPVATVEPEDVSEGVLWLASDEARMVTGVALPIDAGNLAK
jgi:(+)-trans-carveol dehydrogenase